jgi:hypothetical protein
MPWLRVDDAMWRNRKVLPVSPLAKCLYVWSMGYSADQLTDGILKPTDIRQIVAACGIDDWQGPMQELVDAGLMEIGPTVGSYIIHDYLDYNPCREAVLRERAENAQRQADWKSGKRREQPLTTPPTNAVSNSVSNPVTASVPYPYPYPSLSSRQPDHEDDPLLERMQQHEVTYSVAVTLIAGKEALATAWLNYADAHPNIPNVPALLTKNIRAGRMPPNGHSPPGKPPPRAISGLSEADLEVQRELQRAKAQPTTSGPAPPE